MLRQRALAWAAVLALVATVAIAPLPARFSAPFTSALAQSDSAAAAGAPTDLAIAALQCDEAPPSPALTSFFSTGAAPTTCAPAVGVKIAVTENGDPVSGSPFTTDAVGTVVVPVGLGSAVEVREDPKSLPAGYEPLSQEANGVPYANPVRLDSAVADAAVLFVNLPGTVTTELAQDVSGADAGEATDLAVVTLQCADAPEAATLTSFFSSGTPPSGCAPAVGVSVAVTENEKPLSGSPFITDTDGSLVVRVGLGSAVTVKEDAKSLPSGYEPLTRGAKDVPYANPVQLDSATAEAAVLFVNVPASVAARLNQDTLAVGTGGATNLAHPVSQDRTGCDPAYPDERTCIAPGRPLAEPCSITDQRNFTVLPPDPRRLDADHDGIGCEPIAPRGGTIVSAASPNLYSSGGYPGRAAPARTGYAGVAASPVYRNYGVRSAPPQASRGDGWMVRRDGNRAGLWFMSPARTSTGSVAIASNPVFISSGLWSWSNRFGNDDWFWHNRDHNHDGSWFWQNRNHNLNGVWFRPSTITVGNLTIAGSGSGNVAIASNPVFISTGVWSWRDHSHDDDWSWRNRFGNGSWNWLNWINVGNITVAGSGNGNVAIASNPVFISNGLWRWSGQTHNDGWFWNGHDHNDWSWRDRFGSHVWGWPSRISVGNLAVARSGNGNVAIASNPIFIGGGLSTWQNRQGNDDWGWGSRFGNRFGSHIWGWPSTISVGNLTVAGSGIGNVAIASNPVFISSGVWHLPGHINNGGWLWNNHMNNGQWRGSNHFGNSVWGWPSTIFVGNLTIARSGDNIAIVSNPIVIISSGLWFVPPDRNHDHDWINHDDRDHGDGQVMHAEAAQAGTSDAEPMTINGGGSSEVPSKIEPAGSSEQPSVTVNGTLAVEPSPTESMQSPSDGATQAPAELDQPTGDGDVALLSAGSVETPSDGTGAAPLDAAIKPAADAGAADASYVAPDPSSVNGGTVDAGSVDAGYVAPDPGTDPSYVAPDPAVDAGYVDPGYVEPEPVYVAPEPSYVDPGNAAPEPNYVEPTYVEPTYVEPSYVEPSSVDPGYADPGYAAPEPNYVAPEPSSVDPGIDAGYVAPEPSYSAPEPSYAAPEPSYSEPEPNYSAPEPNYVDAGNGASNPGMDSGNFAPEPSFADPGMGAGNGNPGNGDAGTMAQDAGMDSGGNVDTGSVAPDSGGGGGGGGGRKGHHNHG